MREVILQKLEKINFQALLFSRERGEYKFVDFDHAETTNPELFILITFDKANSHEPLDQSIDPKVGVLPQ